MASIPIPNQSYSSGGSAESASSLSNGWSSATSSSRTYGNAASAQSIKMAQNANDMQEQFWKMSAQYNAEQAALERAWQENLANTTIQRTVKDMIAAGINPILAASAGFSADNVGNGAVASASPASAYMATAYPETKSKSKSKSKNKSTSSSSGSSWNQAESGLITLLKAGWEMGASAANSKTGKKAKSTLEKFINNWAKGSGYTMKKKGT